MRTIIEVFSDVCAKYYRVLDQNKAISLFFEHELRRDLERDLKCKVQTTLRVVENFGGRVFSTTESFSTIESAQN